MRFSRSPRRAAIFLAIPVLFSALLLVAFKKERKPVQPPYVQYTLESSTTDLSVLHQITAILDQRLLKSGIGKDQFSFSVDSGRIVLRVADAIKDQQRLRKLLQADAVLRFHATYTFGQLMQQLRSADKQYREQHDSLLSQEGMLFGKLAAPLPVHAPASIRLDAYEQEAPVIGYCAFSDTAAVGAILRTPEIAAFFPPDLAFMWSATASSNAPDPSRPCVLYAVKTKGDDVLEPGTMKAVELKKADYGPYVSVEFNTENTEAWARLTKANVRRAIAIEVDGLIYSCPTVQEEIKGGKASITGPDVESMQNLSYMLSAGPLPARVRIVEERLVEK